MTADERRRIHAIEETISVVRSGEDGTSYVLREFEVDPAETVPEPDEGCEWVEDESNGGTGVVRVDGITVDCDVETAEDVEVQDGGVVIGDTTGEAKGVDADDARFYGSAVAENVFNLQDGLVTGDVSSATEEVKLDNATVEGSAEAAETVEVIGGSSGGGDAVSDGGTGKVLDGRISGTVATDGDVKLQNATVGGHVHVDPAEFNCTNSTVDGQDCGGYVPKDPDDY